MGGAARDAGHSGRAGVHVGGEEHAAVRVRLQRRMLVACDMKLSEEEGKEGGVGQDAEGGTRGRYGINYKTPRQITDRPDHICLAKRHQDTGKKWAAHPHTQEDTGIRLGSMAQLWRM